MHKIARQKNAQRKEGGFSIVTVIAIGIVASLWAVGMMAVLMPTYQKAVYARSQNMLRSASEAALDWAVNTLSDPLTAGAIDDTTANDANYNVQSVPKTVLGSPSDLGATATITVKNISVPQNSYLYDETIPQNPNYWRHVEATATMAGKKRTVSVILRPRFDTTQTTVQTVTQGPPEAIFQAAAFGLDGVTVNGNAKTNSYRSSLGYDQSANNGKGDIGTNGKINLSGNAIIGGDVNTFGKVNDGTQVTGSGTVHGDIKSDGYIDSSKITLPDQNSQVSPQDDTNTYKQVPPVQTAPDDAVNLGALSLSGKQTMTLAPGNYIVSSLSITGQAQLVLPQNGTVNLYVQGAQANIQIAGNGISNPGGRPTNLRLWYPGTNTVTIGGNGNFVGVVYAPNATVNVGGNGEAFGAVIGANVNFNGGGNSGYFHYDEDLAQDQTLMWNPPLIVNNIVNTTTYSGMQTVSWQEL